jgi:hypothetical protein
MAKVTVHKDAETPSQAIVKAANQPHTRTDASGRTIGIRKMQALDRLKMFEVVGPDNAKNEPYLGYAALAFHVASIDGDPVNRPSNKLQLEALIQRLGDDGMNAVGEAVQEMFLPKEEDAELIKN